MNLSHILIVLILTNLAQAGPILCACCGVACSAVCALTLFGVGPCIAVCLEGCTATCFTPTP